MSSEELVVRIQAGERDRLPELWAGVERFVWQQARRRAHSLESVTVEDLYQSGYLAMVKAVEGYDPAAGMSFVGWLALHLKNAFAEAGGYLTQRQRQDPIRHALSLEAPLSDDDPLTLADVVPDPAAAEAFEAVEGIGLREAVERALQSLTEGQRTAVLARYYLGHTLTPEGRKQEAKALRALRHPRISRELMRYW